jgi:hypothetical protein
MTSIRHQHAALDIQLMSCICRMAFTGHLLNCISLGGWVPPMLTAQQDVHAGSALSHSAVVS